MSVLDVAYTDRNIDVDCYIKQFVHFFENPPVIRPDQIPYFPTALQLKFNQMLGYLISPKNITDFVRRCS